MSLQSLSTGSTGSTGATEWEIALRELAIESEVSGLDEPSRIKSAIILERCTRESRLRQFELSNAIMRERQIPGLEEQLRETQAAHDAEIIDSGTWMARARSAEGKVSAAIAVVTVFAMIAVAALAYTVHVVIERTTR
jgi:hypothetical protein